MYATQAEVEAVLGRSLTVAEATGLPFMMSGVDAYIDGQTGTSFEVAVEATKYYDVDWGSRILETDTFVTDNSRPFTVEYVDDDEVVVSVVDSSVFEARPRNEITKNYLEKRDGLWGYGSPSTVANIAVTAFFGYDSVPADIAYVAAWLVAQRIGGAQSLSLKSESIEGYSRTFADIASSKEAMFVGVTLERYKDVIV